MHHEMGILLQTTGARDADRQPQGERQRERVVGHDAAYLEQPRTKAIANKTGCHPATLKNPYDDQETACPRRLLLLTTRSTVGYYTIAGGDCFLLVLATSSAIRATAAV